jgi:hypothetical protein
MPAYFVPTAQPQDSLTALFHKWLEKAARPKARLLVTLDHIGDARCAETGRDLT